MQVAITNAESSPTLIENINAHAASTQIGDVAKRNAITRILWPKVIVHQMRYMHPHPRVPLVT